MSEEARHHVIRRNMIDVISLVNTQVKTILIEDEVYFRRRASLPATRKLDLI